MQRDTFHTVIILVLGMLLLLVSCATSTTAEPMHEIESEVVFPISIEDLSTTSPETETPIAALDAPDEQQNSIAQLIKPKRVFHYGDVPRYGEYLIVSNETGYTLVQLDIFNESMYRSNDQMDNLLEPEALIHHGQQRIALFKFPLLQQALEQQGKESYSVNAIDIDGDRYSFSWLPETDSWNIEITEDELTFSFDDVTIPPSQGDYFLITNGTEYPLSALYVIDPTDNDEIASTNLLGDMVLLPTRIVHIATDDVPWIADQLPFDTYGRVEILAEDTDGDIYKRLWFPTTDIWNIELTIANLQYDVSLDTYELYVENNTNFDIWYLYLATDEYYDVYAFGEDLLEDSILYAGESTYITLSQFSHLNELLASDSDEPLHLVGLDLDNEEYHLLWSPHDDGWSIELTNENFRSEPLPEAPYGYATLLARNRTGEDIWHLYMITDEMDALQDNGLDVLGDIIWRSGDTQAIVPESFAWVLSWLSTYPDSSLNLIAETYDGITYTRPWSPSVHGWLIDLSSEDLLKEM
nr:hypothetical protein [uncultured Sphaerochaeta sp.]